MNTNQLWSALRFTLAFGGGILVTFGFLSTEQLAQITTILTQIAGPISALGALGWSIYTHNKANTVSRAADIVSIPPAVQRSAGVTTPVLVPTSPPATPLTPL